MSGRETDYKRGPVTRPPTHPGAILREDILPDAGLSVLKAAEMLEITRQNLHRVLREDGPVTPNLAVRLSALFGGSSQNWLNMQSAHDLWHVERKLRATARKIAARARGLAA